jgi:FAD/FMN-containing dehydrogenase
MRQLAGWGRYPVLETQWRSAHSRSEAIGVTMTSEGVIARGNGRAYGDAAIGVKSTLSMTALDRMVRFDSEGAYLTVEAGVLLADVIATLLPRGFFPYAVPGTRYVTIGGAIAADVHGKNHHHDGGFGEYLVDVTLVTGGGEVVRASREQNREFFFNTIGGMGLTGTILEATIKLRRVETAWIRQVTIVANDLKEAVAALDAADGASYSVAWIDCAAKGKRLGRSLVFLGEHATKAELQDSAEGDLFPWVGDPKLAVPVDFPNFALNHRSVAAFNEAYFRLGARKSGKPLLVAAGPYFFPLDGIADWNRVYGRRGFVQNQCVLPLATAPAALSEILDRVARRGDASFLSVLKKLGRANGILSFPFEGYTLALDFPVTSGLFDFLHELDQVVVRAGGRLYLAKDARQSRETFDAGYANADRFRDFRKAIDPSARIRSHLSNRLGL